ncbi:MAG TPA: three-Cys-motif partner protein TcmP [Thermoanaerobaculia bacterium]|nr:three-Cys-motif partner protein TcmP [Thermoanaerobaculia bacterium]
MKGRKSGTSELQSHRFGGDWTEKKLEILRRYLEAYAAVLKKKSFKTAYIDAFAGTGYRSAKQSDEEGSLLFPDLAEETAQGLLDGSARMALGVEPRFDKYIFIERDQGRCLQLETLKQEFPHLAEAIDTQPSEANRAIQRLCRKNWTAHRAVLFLDPYGMQVEWTTIEKVAQTGAIDLWLLVPLGIGVNRLLPRSGEIPEGWRNRLNLFLGSDDWYQAFYKVEKTPTLFGDEKTTVVKAGVEVIGRYVVDRLRSVFPGVAPNPKVLMNSTGCPLYLFCFAVSSPSPQARRIALRIADHILKGD